MARRKAKERYGTTSGGPGQTAVRDYLEQVARMFSTDQLHLSADTIKFTDLAIAGLIV